MSNKADAVAITDEGTSYAELGHSRLYVWNTGGLVWERMTQPGGVGGGGTQYVEDVASAGGETGTLALGYRQDADTSPVSASGDFHGLIFDALGNLKVNVKAGGAGGGAVTVADGADVAEGATTNAAVITDVAGTVSGKLRGLVKWAFERMPAALGQTTMAASLPVTIASNQSALPVTMTSTTITGTVAANVNPTGETAGVGIGAAADLASSNSVIGRLKALIALLPTALGAGGGLKVDGSGTALPVSGTLTVNTGLTDTQLRATAVPVSATQLPAALAAGGGMKVEGVAGGVAQPVSGTVTANAGTGPFPVSDNAGSLTVDAPVGTPVFVELSDGAAVWKGQKVMASSLPVTMASDQTGMPVTVAATLAVEQVPGTNGGYSISKTLAAATTNATSVKGSAGKLFGWYIANAAAYTVFVKLFNKATAPTVGTDTPVITIPIPAGAAANVEFTGGIAFATGIGFSATKLVADLDATVLVANDVVINLFYK